MTWKIYTMADAYAVRPPVKYAVDGFFEFPSVNIVYGAPSSLKSMLMLDMCMCVVTGNPWLTNSDGIAAKPTTKTNALWVDFDNGKRMTADRIKAIGTHYKVAADDPSLTFVSCPELGLDMGDPKSVLELETAIESTQAKLVVVDNLGLVSGGTDENSNGMVAIMGAFRKLAEMKRIAFVIIHHERKGSSSHVGRLGDTLRGHSSIEKAFDVKFSNKENQLEHVWATSWGVSTRLVGALVMAHSDDQGLILPPRIAPLQVVIVPIYKGDEQKALIDAKANALVKELKSLGIRVKYDDNDNNRPGWKFAEYEMKGVPVRLALGARDLEKNVVEVARRDTKEKMVVALDGIPDYVHSLLADIQRNMFNKAKAYRDEHITPANSWEEFEKLLDEKGGFISAHWDGTPETEDTIKEKTKATIRCIPLNNVQEEGLCILTRKPSAQRVLFARAY